MATTPEQDAWRAEFYPVRADEVTKEYAVEHSLQKWRGLRRSNLERHGFVDTGDDGKLPLSVDSSTCALCEHHLKKGCPTCPITLATGDRCDKIVYGKISPWRVWTLAHNPEPMIKALEAAQLWEARPAQTWEDLHDEREGGLHGPE